MKDPEFKAMMNEQGLSKDQIMEIMCPQTKSGKSKESSNKFD
jgi:hypothetical protein